MIQNIEAIFIDLGNTLRILIKDPQHMARARQRIVELVGTAEDPVAFVAKLDERYKVYRKWAFENLREAPESEMWTRWLAPDFPAERIAPLGPELTYQYRQSMGRRVVVNGGREVVDELQRRGYILGIISNLIGKREIPEWLENENFTPYFKTVVLSSVLGIRKPDPEIYIEAARRAGVEPARWAYGGGNLKRDGTGARAAGFGMVVIMISPEKLMEETITDDNRPDVIIPEFMNLLDVFPALEQNTTKPIPDVARA
jgi:putative hydrolase of the HAD superfamily